MHEHLQRASLQVVLLLYCILFSIDYVYDILKSFPLIPMLMKSLFVISIMV